MHGIVRGAQALDCVFNRAKHHCEQRGPRNTRVSTGKGMFLWSIIGQQAGARRQQPTPSCTATSTARAREKKMQSNPAPSVWVARSPGLQRASLHEINKSMMKGMEASQERVWMPVGVSSDEREASEASRVLDMPGRDNEVKPEIHRQLLRQPCMWCVVKHAHHSTDGHASEPKTNQETRVTAFGTNRTFIDG